MAIRLPGVSRGTERQSVASIRSYNFANPDRNPPSGVSPLGLCQSLAAIGLLKLLEQLANAVSQRPLAALDYSNLVSAEPDLAATTAGATTIPIKARAMRRSCMRWSPLWCSLEHLHNLIIDLIGKNLNPTKTALVICFVLPAYPLSCYSLIDQASD